MTCNYFREVLIKSLGSSVHPRVPCGLCFLPTLNKSFHRSHLINRFGKGTASAVPPRANKDAGFSPRGSYPSPLNPVHETSSSNSQGRCSCSERDERPASPREVYSNISLTPAIPSAVR